MSQSLDEQALRDFLCHRGNPLALARRAAREAPDQVGPLMLEASLLLCSRDVRDFREAAMVHARMLALKQKPGSREAAHVAALAAGIAGDYERACGHYDQLLAENPHDLLALAVSQVFDYYLGYPQSMLARTTRVLGTWAADRPGYHAVLSMHAFALEECGDYARAEDLAREALAIEPLDLRAHHAVAHVMEMQGRFRDGVRWMGERSGCWIGAGPASTHLWWHLALYHIELGQHRHALAIHDRRMQGGSLSELIDASALLWRLHLQGLELGERFAALASRWAVYADDAHCAFNDVHAMMAFAAGGRWDCAQRLIAAQERRIAGPTGTNRDMTQLVGLPACRALAAFGRGDFDSAERLLRALPPVAHRIGGSHAQRDVLHMTRYCASLLRRKSQPLQRAA